MRSLTHYNQKDQPGMNLQHFAQKDRKQNVLPKSMTAVFYEK